MKISVSLIITFFLSIPVAFAKDSSVSMNNTQFSSSVSSSSSTTLSQEQLAKMYGMDMQQWKEYQIVMKGPRGLWSPNIHPLMALGMRKGITNAERKKLAKQYATIHFERVKRELAFEHDVFEAGMKKYGHLPLFREDFLTGKSTEDVEKTVIDNATTKRMRIQYFVKPGRCFKCRDKIQKWIETGKKVDLYIAGNRKEINRFAKSMGISPLLVPGQITLNPMSENKMRSLGIKSLPAIRFSKEKA